MKLRPGWFFTVVLLISTFLCGCSGGGNSPGGGSSGDGGHPFDMAMAHISGATGFPTGGDDSGSSTINYSYSLAKYDVTYQLWQTVFLWATSFDRGANRYQFWVGMPLPGQVPGRGGYGEFDELGRLTVKTYDSGHDNDPVTNISWREAMLWCNAVTEYYNAMNHTNLDCVYYSDEHYTTPIRSVDAVHDIHNETALPGHEDFPYVKAAAPGNCDTALCIAKGFRLPSSMEWELAARYIGPGRPTASPLSNDAKLANGIYWTPGSYASGATGPCTDQNVTNRVAWSNDNSNNSTQSVGTKTPNALGLYDMSGNVAVWCADWEGIYTEYKLLRGHSWAQNYNSLQLGLDDSGIPYGTSPACGFRIAKTD